MLRCDCAKLPASSLASVEADTYWCLTKLLDNIQARCVCVCVCVCLCSVLCALCMCMHALLRLSITYAYLTRSKSHAFVRARPLHVLTCLRIRAHNSTPQDHYTFSQPGLQRMVLRLEDLVVRLDRELHDHFVEQVCACVRA